MAEPLRILLVDDEARILDGLVRLLRPLRGTWEVRTATSGGEALAQLEQQGCQVVVSDMRMPGMDGAELLAAVQQRWPDTIRFILSGHADTGSLRRASGRVHRFLAKPCTFDALRLAVERSIGLRRRLAEPAVHEALARLDGVPESPRLFQRFLGELRAATGWHARAATHLRDEPDLADRLVAVANGRCFLQAGSDRIGSLVQAMEALGANLVGALVLLLDTLAIPTPGDGRHPPAAQWIRACQVGALASRLIRGAGADGELVETTATAGLLHLCGCRLVPSLRVDGPAAVLLRQSGHEPVEVAETAVYGISNPLAGSWLLARWGLPDAVVEAVAHRFDPAAAQADWPSPVLAVHLADGLLPPGPELPAPTATLDHALLSKLGLDRQLTAWRSLAQEIIG